MANWYYYDSNGTKKGPINGQILKFYVRQKKITPDTTLETEKGVKGLAGNLPGLFSPSGTIPQAPPVLPSAPVSEPVADVYPLSAPPSPPPTPSPIPQSSVIPAPPQNTAATSGGEFFCTNCGNPVGAKTFACTTCGARPVGHNRFCYHCGSPLKPEQVVCVNCGCLINNETKKSSNKSDSTSGNEKKQKDKLTAGLLAIFLGGLGIHEFYLGHTVSGLVFLLLFLFTCGVAGFVTSIIALIQGIRYLCASDEEFQRKYVNNA